jgi:hypothetical protein
MAVIVMGYVSVLTCRETDKIISDDPWPGALMELGLKLM